MKFLQATLILLFAAAFTACSSPNDATKALKAQGFTDIETHGRAFFACSEDDTFATKFTATNPKGERVAGTVCSGWLKGATIRYD